MGEAAEAVEKAVRDALLAKGGSQGDELAAVVEGAARALGLTRAEFVARAAASPAAAVAATHEQGQQQQQQQQQQARGAGGKPVRAYLDGCFDIMHSGHYNALRQAHMICDVLVVGVHSDREITACKGPPVMNDAERVAMVKACKWADEVVFDTPYSPTIELLDRLNCDFCIHGDDMPISATGEDAYAPMKNAGRMRVIKRTEGVSTTDLVGRLLLMTKGHHVPEIALSHSPSLSAEASRATAPEFPPLPAAAAADADKPAPVRSPSPVPAPAPAAAAPAAADSDIYGASSSGMSTFLPTTRRIAQFSSNRQPKPGDTVVYIDGAFDLFHVAHVEALERARALGDFLYVGVHSDEVVNKHKGRNYPIMNLHERVLNVLSCKYVDEVVIGAPWNVRDDLLRTLNISLVARGGVSKDADDADDAEAGGDDPYRLAKERGIFRVISTKRQLSTTLVVQRIIDNRMAYEARNSKRGKKEKDYLESREYVAEQ